MSDQARAIAQKLRRHFERGFPQSPGGDSLLTGYQWIKLVQEQTNLPFNQAEVLALEIAPEFTAEFWEKNPNTNKMF